MSDDKIECPIIEKVLERLICEDVALSAEGMQPVRFTPEEIRAVASWREICLNCPKHPE